MHGRPVEYPLSVRHKDKRLCPRSSSLDRMYFLLSPAFPHSGNNKATGTATRRFLLCRGIYIFIYSMPGTECVLFSQCLVFFFFVTFSSKFILQIIYFTIDQSISDRRIDLRLMTTIKFAFIPMSCRSLTNNCFYRLQSRTNYFVFHLLFGVFPRSGLCFSKQPKECYVLVFLPSADRYDRFIEWDRYNSRMFLLI